MGNDDSRLAFIVGLDEKSNTLLCHVLERIFGERTTGLFRASQNPCRAHPIDVYPKREVSSRRERTLNSTTRWGYTLEMRESWERVLSHTPTKPSLFGESPHYDRAPEIRHCSHVLLRALARARHARHHTSLLSSAHGMRRCGRLLCRGVLPERRVRGRWRDRRYGWR